MSRILPILFNTEMVRAILDGRKTVTRRVVKPQPKMRLCYAFAGYGHGKWHYPDKNAWEYWGEEFKRLDNIESDELKRTWTPPCHTDDILYVRETWFKDVNRYMYKADYSFKEKFYKNGKEIVMRWKSSIHMPKEAARIFLKVTDVRIEQLNMISEEDMVAEGIYPYKEQKTEMELNYGILDGAKTEIELEYEFADLWDSTLKKSDLERYGWDANPWVWVIKFKKCERPKVW